MSFAASNDRGEICRLRSQPATRVELGSFEVPAFSACHIDCWSTTIRLGWDHQIRQASAMVRVSPQLGGRGSRDSTRSPI